MFKNKPKSPSQLIHVIDCQGEEHTYDGDKYKWWHGDGACRIYNGTERITIATFSNPIKVELKPNV